MKAPFISFEGGEGGGKSTQIQLLAKYLREKGQDVCITREPGGTPGAEELRNLLLNGSPDRWDAWTELMLNSASRRDHMIRKVVPMCKKGTWVVSDRYVDSSRVYQGLVGGVPLVDVDHLQFSMLKLPKPDLTVLLDLSVEQGMERVKKRHIQVENVGQKKEDRYEKKGLYFHERVRDAFLQLSALEPERFIVVRADQSVEDVAVQICAEVNRRWSL